MDNQQRKTLQSLLRITPRTEGPAQVLDEIRMALTTRLGLYQQEKDAEGVALIKPVLQLAQKARTVEELEAAVSR